MLREGSEIRGTWRIRQEIGRGGMSVVFLAVDEISNQKYAVKEIRPDGKEELAILRKSLEHEAEILRELSHPGIVRLEAVVTGRDGILLIQDYIEGDTLQQILDERGAQSEKMVAEWGIQLCDILNYMHGLSPPVLYLDLKPSNIIRQPDGTLVLIDFGSARRISSIDSNESKKVPVVASSDESGVFSEPAFSYAFGTAVYTAGEQRTGKNPDARSDIYSLGITLYQLTTGRLPEKKHEDEVFNCKKEKSVNGFLPIIKKCMEEDPKNRYDSVESLKIALADVLKQEKIRIVKARRKLRIQILLSLLLFLSAFLINLIFFYLIPSYQKKCAMQKKNEAYALLMKKAENASEEQNKSYYAEAMELLPEEPEAYLGYWEAALSDGVLSETEDYFLQEAFDKIPEGREKNVQQILAQKQSADIYPKLCYELSMGYYCFYEGSRESGRSRALFWMEEYLQAERAALQTGNFQSITGDSWRTERMEILQAIAQESDAMNLPDTSEAASSSFRKCWEEYQQLLVNLDAAQTAGEEESLTALQLLIEVSGQIQDHAREFERCGITIEAMQRSLEQIEGMASVIYLSTKKREESRQEQTQKEEELYWTLEENQEAARAKLEFMKIRTTG